LLILSVFTKILHLCRICVDCIQLQAGRGEVDGTVQTHTKQKGMITMPQNTYVVNPQVPLRRLASPEVPGESRPNCGLVGDTTPPAWPVGVWIVCLTGE